MTGRLRLFSAVLLCRCLVIFDLELNHVRSNFHPAFVLLVGVFC